MTTPAVTVTGRSTLLTDCLSTENGFMVMPMATNTAKTPADPMRDAEALGAWLLIEFPDGCASRFAYRPLYEVLPGRWLFVSPDDENAHIAPAESVQTLVSHRDTSVSVVEEPSFLPGGDSA